MMGQKVEHPDPISMQGPPAILTPRGLMVRYPGFRLHGLNKDARRLILPLDENSLNLKKGSSIEDTRKLWFPTDKFLLEWYVVERADIYRIDATDASMDQQNLQIWDNTNPALILPRQNRGSTPEISLLVAAAARGLQGQHRGED